MNYSFDCIVVRLRLRLQAFLFIRSSFIWLIYSRVYFEGNLSTSIFMPPIILCNVNCVYCTISLPSWFTPLELVSIRYILYSSSLSLYYIFSLYYPHWFKAHFINRSTAKLHENVFVSELCVEHRLYNWNDSMHGESIGKLLCGGWSQGWQVMLLVAVARHWRWRMRMFDVTKSLTTAMLCWPWQTMIDLIGPYCWCKFYIERAHDNTSGEKRKLDAG